MSDNENDLGPEQANTCQLSRRDFLKLLATAGLVVGCSASQRALSPDESSTSSSKYDFSQISFCGIYCEDVCPERAYPKSCDGCKIQGGKCAPYCCGCPVRKCAQEKGMLTCAHCNGFPTCDKDTWKTYPSLRGKIEQLRAELQIQP